MKQTRAASYWIRSRLSRSEPAPDRTDWLLLGITFLGMVVLIVTVLATVVAERVLTIKMWTGLGVLIVMFCIVVVRVVLPVKK